jgi:hypothetical protein
MWTTGLDVLFLDECLSCLSRIQRCLKGNEYVRVVPVCMLEHPNEHFVGDVNMLFHTRSFQFGKSMMGS